MEKLFKIACLSLFITIIVNSSEPKRYPEEPFLIDCIKNKLTKDSAVRRLALRAAPDVAKGNKPKDDHVMQSLLWKHAQGLEILDDESASVSIRALEVFARCAQKPK